MFEKLKIHLIDSLEIPGDILDFRIYDGLIFSEIANLVQGTGKRVIGFDSFSGLPVPTQPDMSHYNFNEVKHGQFFASELNTRILILKNSPHKEYEIVKTDYISFSDVTNSICFALLDLRQYAPTKLAIEYIWERINYGGTIYVSNFDESQNHSQYLALKEFLLENSEDISVSRQMMVNGFKEKFIAIKCYHPRLKPLFSLDYRNKDKITIATVLKTGGPVYDHHYVNALAAAVKANVTVDHEFVVLTNDSTGFSADVDKVIKFVHDYPTWWGKVELFNPDNFTTDRVFYLDLDTAIVGNIDELVSYDGAFAGLRDFYALHSLGSGIMGWDKHLVSKIYYDFIPRANEIISSYRGGDQVWIDEKKPSIEYLQDIYHNQIVSFKRHCMVGNLISVPAKAKIVCFHGNPRPHTIQHELLKKYW